jgi:Uma2 family endonuclease
MVLQTPLTRPVPEVTWEPLPADFILPDDPVENLQQPYLAAALTDALGAANRIEPAMLITTNMGLVATIKKKTVVKAPDWFYVPQVNPIAEGAIRRSYTPNIEGAPVAIAMEFLSETEGGEYSVRPSYPYGKLYFYERILKIPTYVIFDPYEEDLEVRHLENERYVLQAPDEAGRFWIPEVELFLGVWSGTRLNITAHWLRWWDESGNLLLWSSEQAELERQRAEEERQRAEEERQRADAAIAQLDSERQRAEALAAQLRQLGIDPN